jgi:hypothetical protein
MTTGSYKALGTVVGASLDALIAIGKAAESATGKSTSLEEAIAILDGISAVVRSVTAGLDSGATDSADQIDQQRLALGATIAGNNAAIDVSVDAKFPKGDS